MRNRLYFVLGVLLVAALGGLLWWSPWEPREPVYDGKPLSYWLGRNAIPTNVFFTLPNSSAIRRGYPTPLHVAEGAAWVGQVRRDGSNAVPFLIRALRQDKWFGAAFCREWLWARLAPSIQQHLPPPHGPMNGPRTAAFLLSDLGTEARPAVPTLIRELKKNSDAGFRIETVWALWNLGNGDTNVIAALCWALQDNDRVVRRYATNALLDLDIRAASKAGVWWPEPPKWLNLN
jgi:hypothetical protein